MLAVCPGRRKVRQIQPGCGSECLDVLMSRRWFLGTVLGGLVVTGCSPAVGHTAQVSTPRSAAPEPDRHSYGSDPSQWGELYRPSGTSYGTVVVIHGGFWRSEYGADLGAPLAQDLAARGWTAWNIEYRRVGDGGGWPTTVDDVSAAIDLLSTLRVDLTTLVALGHSAGGQLAAWAAHRTRPKARITGVISQAGVLDLTTAANRQVGGTAVPDLLGGTPAQVPDRYQDASPQQHIPLSVPVRCIHARADANVPYDQSADYVAAARAKGADAALTTVPGDHFTLIDPSTPAWQAALQALTDITS